MKIGDRVYVHGYVDEIRKDTVIIRNEGGYFGTVKSEIVEAQKAEDIVSVIRCRECKHALPQGKYGDWFICDMWDHQIHTSLNGYCYKAERKEE